MLQQTQVKTVIPYFVKFTKTFKNLNSLSNSSEKKVLKLWEGLGYYRRARNLLITSKILINKYNSKLPKDINEIKTLPGVGEYTANVLAALIHDKATIAIDGNVKRLFTRVLNKSENEIDFQKFINTNKKNLLNTNRNSDVVEALMEFGALICKPKEPCCSICPIKKNCKFEKSEKKLIQTKKNLINEEFNVFCYLNKNGKIALTKKNKVGFLNKFNLPQIEKKLESKRSFKKWKLLKKYRNSISNKKLNINLYYQFSKRIPVDYNWYSIKNNHEFIPSFTKKIFRQVSTLFQ